MTPIKPSILLAFVFVTTSSLAAEADRKLSILKQCATRDAYFLLQLEQYGEQGDTPGEKLHAAYLTMLRARTACSVGLSTEALALYDSAFGPVRDVAGVKRGSEVAHGPSRLFGEHGR